MQNHTVQNAAVRFRIDGAQMEVTGSVEAASPMIAASCWDSSRTRSAADAADACRNPAVGSLASNSRTVVSASSWRPFDSR